MFYIKLIIFILLFGVCEIMVSQNDFSMFNESNISINHEASSSYKMNFSIKGRNYLYEDNGFFIKQRQMEIGHFSTFGLSPKSSFSLGFMYRNRSWFEGSENELRSTLQFNTKSVLKNFRFGHRFRAEQRFYDSKTVHRFRYRLALDLPLNGEKLNVGEPYLIGSTELLWSLAKPDSPSIDNRFTKQIGWLINDKTKLQFGLEYRLSELNINTSESLFLLTSAIFTL